MPGGTIQGGSESGEAMSSTTKIEWCDATWNPITGCTPCSPGCAHCYARTMLARHLPGMGHPGAPGQVTLHADRLDIPFHWHKPRRIFVCSMSDLFHEDVPSAWLDAAYRTMRSCPQHTFLMLTKRPQNAHDWRDREFPALPNQWLGVTVCNQSEADEKIPVLLQTSAALRFVSIEPMLGPVDLARWLRCNGSSVCDQRKGGQGPLARGDSAWCNPPCPKFLDWVICGGETGPGARRMRADWAGDLRDQCDRAGVPFFFKGWGTWLRLKKTHPDYRLLDDRQWHQFPDVEATP
jgi:protein gp37